MVLSKAIRASGCAGCRLSLVRTFIGVAGLPIRLSHPAVRLPLAASRRRFSSRLAHDDRQEGNDVLEINGEQAEAAQAAEEAVDVTTEDAPEVSTLPWYLQMKTPQQAPAPLSERQRIPELPQFPPPILQPLLQRMSIDLGLDDLSIIDLRKLDPPAALGANLIMLMGTARSEKHLHVSADRLCRWLRSTYKLRPDADGLLGRNEMKLKLRRKSRRAKLMGSAMDENSDDGIRTGWVCVDVGVVEGPEGVVEEEPAPKDFVGFGRRTEGVKVVVQMLTEEKREEIELEKLWSGILKRSIQPLELDEEFTELESPVPASQTSATSRLGNKFSPIVNQSRGFHTLARQQSMRTEGQSNTAAPYSPSDLSQSNIPTQLDLTNLQLLVTLAIESNKPELLQNAARVPTENHSVLQQLQTYLRDLPEYNGLVILGDGDLTEHSTAFLACFHQTLSYMPPQAAWEANLWLNCYARIVGHPGVKRNNYIVAAQTDGIELSPKSYISLLRNLPRPPYASPQRFVAVVMEILQTMHRRGNNVLSEDVFVALLETTTPEVTTTDVIHSDPESTFGLPSLPMPPYQRRIHDLMGQTTDTCFSDAARLRLLDLYSQNQHFAEFWDIFRMPLRLGQPQTLDVYAFMFACVARTGHQRGTITVLQTWVPELERLYKSDAASTAYQSKTSVERAVSNAIKECLKVVDPCVEQDALQGSNGEWARMWRRLS